MRAGAGLNTPLRSKGEYRGAGTESVELPLLLRVKMRWREEAEETRDVSPEDTRTTLEAEETRVTVPEPGLEPARELLREDH